MAKKDVILDSSALLDTIVVGHRVGEFCGLNWTELTLIAVIKMLPGYSLESILEYLCWRSFVASSSAGLGRFCSKKERKRW